MGTPVYVHSSVERIVSFDSRPVNTYIDTVAPGRSDFRNTFGLSACYRSC
jgi:hypothetical protein